VTISPTSPSTVVLDLPNQGLSNVVGQQLATGNDLRPKITVKKGASVDVFVARDLDFSGVPAWK
jgi:type IV secretion system protein VirB10